MEKIVDFELEKVRKEAIQQIGNSVELAEKLATLSLKSLDSLYESWHSDIDMETERRIVLQYLELSLALAGLSLDLLTSDKETADKVRELLEYVKKA